MDRINKEKLQSALGKKASNSSEPFFGE